MGRSDQLGCAGVLAPSIIAGGVTYWALRAFARSGADRFTKVPLSSFLDVRASRKRAQV